MDRAASLRHALKARRRLRGTEQFSWWEVLSLDRLVESLCELTVPLGLGTLLSSATTPAAGDARCGACDWAKRAADGWPAGHR